jgi:Ser/Thr protein kinase RdoA (MazF antagonist)
VEPSWVAGWCLRELGAAPVEEVFAAGVMAKVRAVRLDDGRTVVLKARPAAEVERADRCVVVQRAVADRGFPCARPLTGASLAGDFAVHAEEWRPGGEPMRDDSPEAAILSARLFGELMAILREVDAEPPAPSPEWVGWDHDGPGLFAPNPRHDALAARVELPELIEHTARRVRERLRGARLSPVLGHADWEAQNLRWTGSDPHAVHDWDSLAWQPEAALVGAAAGAFASIDPPTLAPLESSRAFLDAYGGVRGRALDREDLEVAWAASLWPALHNARGEVIHAQPAVALKELERQAGRRLELAGA